MFHRCAPRQGAPTASEFVMTKTSGLYSIAAGGTNATWHTTHVAGPLDVNEADAFRDLSDPERAIARHSESLWRQAYQIARDNPGVDPGDIYHALRCLEIEPAERLRRGLSRGRLRAYAR